ncbi:hypothetical protein Tco_0425072 [Tanacetum coccineum]
MNKKKKHFAKLRAEEIRRKPPTNAQKRNQMCTYLKNMANYKHKVVKGSKSQAKGKLKACLKIVPDDDSAVNVESLATKYPIVDWKTHFLAEDKMYYQIIRADGSAKFYKIFSAMLDDFDRQDMLDLYRLGRIIGIKRHLSAVEVTAAGYISTAGEVQRKYSKSLLLLVVKLLLLVLVTTARRISVVRV